MLDRCTIDREPFGKSKAEDEVLKVVLNARRVRQFFRRRTSFNHHLSSSKLTKRWFQRMTKIIKGNNGIGLMVTMMVIPRRYLLMDMCFPREITNYVIHVNTHTYVSQNVRVFFWLSLKIAQAFLFFSFLAGSSSLSLGELFVRRFFIRHPFSRRSSTLCNILLFLWIMKRKMERKFQKKCRIFDDDL